MTWPEATESIVTCVVIFGFFGWLAWLEYRRDKK